MKKQTIIMTVAIAMLLCITGLSACNQSSQEHKRKTIPLGNLTALQSDRFAEDAFNPDHDGLQRQFNSTVPAGYASVQLPDASKDGKVIDLINTFKPTAISYLQNLSRQYGGIAIDLSNHDGETFTTTFNLSQTGGFNLPVIVIWDQRNNARLKRLQNLATGVEELSLQYKSGDLPAGQIPSEIDCFNTNNQ